MVNVQQFEVLEYNRLAVAELLKVPIETLPMALEENDANDAYASRLTFVPLSDDEWEIIAPHLPALPVPKPRSDFRDRTFVDSALWFVEASSRGLSWHFLPAHLGPHSSRSHRYQRWVLLDYWDKLAENLARDGRLLPDRLRAFQRIAAEAFARKERVLARRSRLTDVR